jgi:hypothetical protein
MLLYDHKRTEKIVDRLRTGEKLVRASIVLTAVAFFACAGGLFLGAVTGSNDRAATGAILGAIVGLCVGLSGLVLIMGVVEWMAHVLIAQGELLDNARQTREEKG